MKKILFLTLVFAFLISLQEKSNAQFNLKLGPVTGMNFNIGTGSDLPETSSGFGFLFGAQVDMNFTPVIGLITNLQFYDNRSGGYNLDGTLKGTNTAVTEERNFSVAYFLIEPLFKLRIPGSGFYFVVGPELGFTVQSSFSTRLEQQNGNPINYPGTTTNKSKGSLKNTNARFAIKLGSGIDLPVGKLVTLAPQLNFGYGITTFQENFESRILTIQALLAVKFTLIR